MKAQNVSFNDILLEFLLRDARGEGGCVWASTWSSVIASSAACSTVPRTVRVTARSIRHIPSAFANLVLSVTLPSFLASWTRVSACALGRHSPSQRSAGIRAPIV